MQKRILVFVLCAAALGLFVSTISFAADKVGYINLQRLVNESNMGKAARADIQKMRQQKEKDLKVKLEDFNALRDKLNKEGAKMEEGVKKENMEQLRQAYKEYQRLLDDAKEDIVREDKELVAIILQKADGILKEVAKKNKYSIILKDPNAVGYLDPDVDITDLVLKELNK
ncbi:MAG: OmpH family outer membrane protein [Deltaproteobacteria bacterium]|nr:OmpH family outer membrane protein [Deltaproteobacteria bacterium]